MNLFWTLAVLVYCLRNYFTLDAKYERYKEENEGSKNFMGGVVVFVISEIVYFGGSVYLLLHLFRLLELV